MQLFDRQGKRLYLTAEETRRLHGRGPQSRAGGADPVRRAA